MFQLKNQRVNKAPLWLVEKRYRFSTQHASDTIFIRSGMSEAELIIKDDHILLRVGGDKSVSVNTREPSHEYVLNDGDRFSVAGELFEVIEPKLHSREAESSSLKTESQCLHLIPERAGAETLRLDCDKTLGRSQDCDIHLRGARLSRRHAQLTPTEAGCLVKDLDSVNGVFVNGERVGEALLKDGDRITFAEYAYKVVGIAEEDLDKTKARPVSSRESRQRIKEEVTVNADVNENTVESARVSDSPAAYDTSENTHGMKFWFWIILILLCAILGSAFRVELAALFV